MSLTLTWWPSFARAECVTDLSRFWVCKGDVAPATGYLIPPDKLDMRKVPEWKRKAQLLDETLRISKEIQAQRDRYKAAFEEAEGVMRAQALTVQSLKVEAERKPSWLVVFGAGAGALLVGLVTGYITGFLN